MDILIRAKKEKDVGKLKIWMNSMGRKKEGKGWKSPFLGSLAASFVSGPLVSTESFSGACNFVSILPYLSSIITLVSHEDPVI